ncbi:MAG: endonuclease/exonuclease/phosphatase family protein [Myxococcales bacterium]|nr:endonuclease/exonuclease/phosphatase family protein [Myxococcales bacterium]
MRRPCPCQLSVLLALGALGCGERPLEPRDPTPGVPHYEIQSYNVEAGDHDDPSTVAAIGKNHADIICLQESTPEFETVLRLRYGDEYPYQLYQHNQPDPGAAGLAVLSKFPVSDSGWHPGPNGWHPAWHVLVETPTGKLQILNVHLRSKLNGAGNAVSSYISSSDDHVFEIKQFIEQCSNGLPTLVVGDFNEGVSGSAVEYLEDRGYRNVLPLYHPGQPTWRGNSIANQFTETLDHVLFDKAFEPLNAWVSYTGGSDHLPVVAHLEAAYDWQTGP